MKLDHPGPHLQDGGKPLAGLLTLLLTLSPVLGFLLALPFVSPVQAGSVVQSSSGAIAGFAYGSSVTAGHILVAVIAYDTGSASCTAVNSFTDTQSNTWTQQQHVDASIAGNCGSSFVYTATAGSSGADTVSITYSVAQASATLFLLEVADVTLTGMTGACGSGILSATSFSTGSVSFSTDAVLVGGGYMVGATGMTYTSGFTAIIGSDSRVAEYATSGVSSPTTFSMTSSGAATNWALCGIQLPTSLVTQPIKVTMSNSAPSATVTVNNVSGCTTITPATLLSDALVHNIKLTPSCTYRLSFSNSGNTRNGFSVSSAFSATSANQNACSSAGSTCIELDLTAYQQVSELFAYAINGGGSGYSSPVLTGTYLGTAGSTIATLTTSATAWWLDFNTGWTSMNPLTGSGGSERWGSNAASGTSSAGQSITITYSHQFACTCSYSVSGGGLPTAPTLSSTQFGSAYSPSLTTTPTSLWLDSGASWTLTPNPLTGSSGTERWQASTAVTSGTVTGAFTLAATYYHEFLLTYSYLLSGGGTFNPPTLAYSQFGAAASSALASAATGYWADSGQSWSLTNPLSGSTATQRGQTTQSTSGTVAAAVTTVFTYVDQFNPAFTYVATGATMNSSPKVTGTQFGAAAQLTLTTKWQNVWLDAGTAWSVPNPFFSNLHNFYPSVAGAVLLSPKSVNVTFNAQSTCTSTNPFTLAQGTCVIPVWYYTFSGVLGNFAVGIFWSVAALALYLKSENVWYPILTFLLAGAGFAVIMPSLFLPMAAFFLLLGLAGSAYQILREH